MMTQRQYDFFRALYEEENTRFKDLVERGKIYLTVVAAYSGLFTFTADKMPGATVGTVPRVVFCLVAGFLVAALISIVRSLGIYSYEGLTDPEKVVNQIGATPQSDDDFFDRRVVDLAVAHNRNEKQNDRRAKCLTVATWLMALGIVFHMFFVFLLLLNQGAPDGGQEKERVKEKEKVQEAEQRNRHGCLAK
jgi:hypothetical protein